MINALNPMQISPDMLQGIHNGLTAPAAPRTAAMPAPSDDVVRVRQPELMSEEEAQQAMADVQDSLSASPGEALSVHGGLDLARVMALLAED
ncbi:hypothetical protein [uncultured Desulfovibrio sp.]|uniref:hypothetical protein n=1 Tax=uncultured Desulfovibrio sp. TaxID=167968 RepID=UPI001B1B185C|nr:hypothetical protein [uncultured Desulfovibrio sp.]MBO5490177.1 hypothetical protein [Desulfovibrio sp.]